MKTILNENNQEPNLENVPSPSSGAEVVDVDEIDFLPESLDEIVPDLQTWSKQYKEEEGEEPNFSIYFQEGLEILDGDKSAFDRPTIKFMGEAWEKAGLGKSNWEKVYEENYSGKTKAVSSMLGKILDEKKSEKAEVKSEDVVTSQLNSREHINTKSDLKIDTSAYTNDELENALSWVTTSFAVFTFIGVGLISLTFGTGLVLSLLIPTAFIGIILFIIYKINPSSIYLKHFNPIRFICILIVPVVSIGPILTGLGLTIEILFIGLPVLAFILIHFSLIWLIKEPYSDFFDSNEWLYTFPFISELIWLYFCFSEFNLHHRILDLLLGG